MEALIIIQCNRCPVPGCTDILTHHLRLTHVTQVDRSAAGCQAASRGIRSVRHVPSAADNHLIRCLKSPRHYPVDVSRHRGGTRAAAIQVAKVGLCYTFTGGTLHACVGMQTCCQATIVINHKHCRRRSRMQGPTLSPGFLIVSLTPILTVDLDPCGWPRKRRRRRRRPGTATC